MMKAAYLVGKEHFEVREAPALQPPPDGVLLAVKACGVCGSDLRRWREGPAEGVAPLVAGHEISGVIVAVGSLVHNYQVGERVAVAPDVHCGKCYYCQRALFNLCDDLNLVGITPGYNGGFAQQMVISAEVLQNGVVHRIPAGLSYPQAALAEPMSSVLAAHQMAGTSLGDTVVVLGAGPIGCLHIAIARQRGAQVILSEPSPMRRVMARPFAPLVIVDPVNEDLVEVVRAATGGVGADIAICANPVADTQAQAVELVRKRGQVILFGGLPKASPLTRLDGNRIHYGEVQVKGSFSYHPSFHALALDTLRRGLIDAGQVITHSFSIDQINAAFEIAASGEALKVMVEMDS
jgi:L-iditol 2-dehydrogenase